MVGAGAQVRVRRGRLVLRAMSPLPAVYRGFVLHPDDEHDPYAFRIDLDAYDLGTVKVVFAPDEGTTRVHLGGLVPLSGEKLLAAPRGRVWTTRAAGALAVAGAARAVRRRRSSPTDGRKP